MQWPVQPRKRSHLQKRWGNEGRKWVLFITSCLMSLTRQQPDAQANRFQCTSLLLDLNFLLAAVHCAFSSSPPISNGHLLWELGCIRTYHLGIWQCSHLLVEKLHHTAPPCTGCTTLILQDFSLSCQGPGTSTTSSSPRICSTWHHGSIKMLAAHGDVLDALHSCRRRACALVNHSNAAFPPSPSSLVGDPCASARRWLRLRNRMSHHLKRSYAISISEKAWPHTPILGVGSISAARRSSPRICSTWHHLADLGLVARAALGVWKVVL